MHADLLINLFIFILKKLKERTAGQDYYQIDLSDFLIYVHGKQLRLCLDGHLS